LKLIFDKSDYNVTVYANGAVVLTDAYILPDIFIIDKQLSGVDGLDICRHLKGDASTRHIPVIILSATPNLEKIAGTAGANAFLEKPFKIKVIRDMVEKYLAA
jgi:CheY-like chemotaxis protein